MSTEFLQIGEVAAHSGVTVQALRYYERRGLLSPRARRASGYREYEPDVVQLVRFVKQAQELGFTLDEIDELIRLRTQVSERERGARDEVRAAVTTKIADVESRIARLESIRATLAELLAICDRMCVDGSSPSDCPIFEAIDTGIGRSGDQSTAVGPRTTSRSG